jgi:hypothetical protein
MIQSTLLNEETLLTAKAEIKKSKTFLKRDKISCPPTQQMNMSYQLGIPFIIHPRL